MVLKNQNYCRRTENLIGALCIWCDPIVSISSYHLSYSWRSGVLRCIWNGRNMRCARVSFDWILCCLLVLERSTILSPIISVLTAHMRYLLFCYRFLTQMGIAGSRFYNCALSVYFVSVIKFGMQEKAFKKKIEFWCHFIPNVFAMGSAIFLQVKGYFNPMEWVIQWLQNSD